MKLPGVIVGAAALGQAPSATPCNPSSGRRSRSRGRRFLAPTGHPPPLVALYGPHDGRLRRGAGVLKWGLITVFLVVPIFLYRHDVTHKGVFPKALTEIAADGAGASNLHVGQAKWLPYLATGLGVPDRRGRCLSRPLIDPISAPRSRLARSDWFGRSKRTRSLASRRYAPGRIVSGRPFYSIVPNEFTGLSLGLKSERDFI